ncbi:MAG: sulfatase-like hydrolase/transferase [Solirubrobacterales bacterium]|nr:sulfatase-like hydrolase/transferase [Solirubrobacterales bacterium]
MMRADRVDILIFTGLMILIGPTLIWLAEMLVRKLFEPAGRPFHAACLGLLFGLVIWQGLFDTMDRKTGLVLLIVVSALIAVAYLRVQMAETMAGLLSLAAPIAVVGFWIAGPTASVILPHGSPEPAGQGNGTPVVVVVLDEFPVSSIESSPGTIDARNFPNFSKLSKESNWYRHVRTVADVTTGAVPALLAGRRRPTESTPPDSRQYPENLFSLMDGAGYEVKGEESITDLCPHDVCTDRSSLKNRLSLMIVNGAKNGHPLPEDGAEDLARPLDAGVAELEPSPKLRADTFIRTLPAGDSQVSFVHLLLPHLPWIYLPDGQDYLAPIAPGLFEDPGPNNDEAWLGSPGEVNSSFQRMQLQTAFLDREIGRLVRKMKRLSIWDKALFAVVADHGESLQVGQFRRYLDRDNSGWILPVPLFVKYPGETGGKPVDRPVNSLDLLPTILSETGVEPPGDLEGVPLNQSGPSPATIESHSSSEGGVKLAESEVRARQDAAVRYRNHVFAGGSLYALAGLAGQIGRPVEKAGNLTPLEATFDPPWPEAVVDPAADRLPAFVSGATMAELSDDTPLALSLNGRIAGTFNSFPGPVPGQHRFNFTLPPRLLRNGTNVVRLFHIAE